LTGASFAVRAESAHRGSSLFLMAPLDTWLARG